MSQPKRPLALAVRGLSKRFERPAVYALDLTVYITLVAEPVAAE